MVIDVCMVFYGSLPRIPKFVQAPPSSCNFKDETMAGPTLTCRTGGGHKREAHGMYLHVSPPLSLISREFLPGALIVQYTNVTHPPIQNANPLLSIVSVPSTNTTMVDSIALSISRHLARTPDVDISRIKGNLSDEEKQLGVKIFYHFVSTREKSYGADVGQRLRMVEMNVWGRDGPAAYGETIFEIEVGKGKH